MTVAPAFQGALAGLLVGEAFGLPYDLLPASEIPGTPEWSGGGVHGRLAGTFGEAGGLCLATTDSLLRKGRFDADDLADSWVRWWAEGVMASDHSAFDAAATTVIALQAIAEGHDPRKAALSGEEARGSGAILRVLPAAFLPAGLEDAQAVDQAVAIATLTQAHPEVAAAVSQYVLLLRRLAEGCAPREAEARAVEQLPAVLEEVCEFDAADAARELQESAALREPENGGYVLDQLGSAWIAARDAGDYTAALRRATGPGGRTAYRCALAGGLAGAQRGLAAVPEAWRLKLRLDAEGKALLARLKLAPAPQA